MWGWYKPSRRRKPKTSVQAKTQRGAFGSSWWAQRWISALENFGWSNRLQRGRSYARSGQVASLDVRAGQVQAQVQGSRPAPYAVTIELKALSDREWDQAIEAMAAQAIFAAKLLAGEMPQDIEEAFQAAKVPLFPLAARDLQTECSCPDYANPCKHIAAVYYLMGERFDEDPFVLFELRGRTKDDIMEALRARRAAATDEEGEAAPALERAPALAELLATYYSASVELETIHPHLAAPDMEAAVLRRLGPAPAETDSGLRAVYRAMTAYALRRALGE